MTQNRGKGSLLYPWARAGTRTEKWDDRRLTAGRIDFYAEFRREKKKKDLAAQTPQGLVAHTGPPLIACEHPLGPHRDYY